MPSQPLLVLAPRVTDDSQAIWKAAIDLGWSTTRIQGWRVPDTMSANDRDIVIYGEPLFAEAVADQLNLVLLEPSVNWLTTVPRELTCRDIAFMSLAQARVLNTQAFVKPADGKIFEPKVYDSGAALPGEDQVDGIIPVLRSGVVDFRLEVRCFIHERRLTTLSPYWRNNALAQDSTGGWSFLSGEEDAATAFACRVLSDERVALPPACTLDVGRLSTGEWAVIEANPCWGAGLYGCDPDAVLSMLRAAVRRRDEVDASVLTWISPRRREQMTS